MSANKFFWWMAVAIVVIFLGMWLLLSSTPPPDHAGRQKWDRQRADANATDIQGKFSSQNFGYVWSSDLKRCFAVTVADVNAWNWKSLATDHVVMPLEAVDCCAVRDALSPSVREDACPPSRQGIALPTIDLEHALQLQPEAAP